MSIDPTGMTRFSVVLCSCVVRRCLCYTRTEGDRGYGTNGEGDCLRCGMPRTVERVACEDGCGEHGAPPGVRLVCAGCPAPPFARGDPRMKGAAHHFSCSWQGARAKQVVVHVDVLPGEEPTR